MFCIQVYLRSASDSDGSAVCGWCDGPNDGFSVGLADGVADGLSDGRAVGAGVGVREGFRVDGRAVGVPDGFGEEGFVVGGFVCPSPTPSYLSKYDKSGGGSGPPGGPARGG